MDDQERDVVDAHVARWADHWKDNPAFGAETEGALTRMGHILRRMHRDQAAAFTDPDFTIEDYRTLHALMVQPYPTEATPAQLAEIAAVTRAAMTSRLDRLAEAGLITRETSATDRRRVLVRPTAAGRQAWERHIFASLRREQQLLRALSTEELVQLNALLRRVIRSFDE
ncbi:MarR family winged helix-turn-helix transcriptional regulator [Plantactinospora sp. KBS50]|uniref:MarR family winged helix-turn-helix transcriptional regulator n=1 Tax=Plantactinospora sp. KBS50 TaxID=2024580 RepID=UPI000BAAF928|nr:MarR family transcriptional regulator [Plantactinospora sp. KBS50]ASW57608.1 MarR family transcriptional regulator [Plantactinospora sp. KBS50]